LKVSEGVKICQRRKGSQFEGATSQKLRQIGRSANRQINHRPEPASAGLVSSDPDLESGATSANQHRRQLNHRPEVGGWRQSRLKARFNKTSLL